MPGVHPLLRPPRFNEYPLRLRLAAKRALAPERTAFDVMNAQVGRRASPAPYRTSMIYVFYTILRQTPLPSAEDVAEAPVLPNIQLALHAVEAVSDFFDDSNPLARDAPELYAALWEVSWPWLQFACTFCEARPEIRIVYKTRYDAHGHFIAHTRSYSDDLKTHEVLLSTPGFLDLVGRAWTTIWEEPAPDRLRCFKAILLRHVLHPANVSDIQMVIDGLGRTVGDVAQTLTNTMRSLGVREMACSQHVYDLLRYIHGMDCDGNHDQNSPEMPGDVGCAAVSIGLLDHLLDAFQCGLDEWTDPNWVNYHPDIPTLTQDFATQVFSKCLRFIRDVFLHTWDVMTALGKNAASRLLRCMAQCIASLPASDIFQPLENVLEVAMPVFLMDVEAVEDLGSVVPECDALVEGKAVLPNRWNEFLDAVDEYSDIADKVAYSPRLVCDNMKCGLVGERKTFKRCSQCKNAHYCSKACQRVDWREGGHNKICIPGQSIGLAKFSRCQRAYLRALLDHDYHRHKTSILEQQAALLAHSPTAIPCICFDYAYVPVRIHVQAANPSELCADDGESWTQPLWEHALSRAGEQYHIHVLEPPVLWHHDEGCRWPRLILLPLRRVRGPDDAMEMEEFHQ